MNLFYLHADTKICAQMHVSKHVIKMILEICQMLSTTHHVTDSDYVPKYKKAFVNHPVTIWMRESKDNYIYSCKLAKELCKEYTYRYHKVHKSEEQVDLLSQNIPLLPEIGFTMPAQAMPDEYKGDCSMESYRNYYFFEKSHIHNWQGKYAGREVPEWITEFEKIFED